jgi:Spy/CpxP family protein refolding chaperone
MSTTAGQPLQQRAKVGASAKESVMRHYRALWIVIPMTSIATLGCPGSGSGNAASSASASASAAPSAPASVAAKPHPRFAGHGGIASSLFRGARDLDLTEAQKDSVDKIETDLKTDDDGIRSAMKAFRTDLVAGVKAGKLDTAKLTADDGVVDKAFADHQAKEAEALNSLHALLDAPHRTTLVAAIRAKQAEHETRATGWMKEADGGAPDWSKKRLDKMTTDLALDAGQQKQVAAMLAKTSDPPNAAGMQSRWDDRKKRADALLTAFATDPFDAKTLDLSILPGKTAHDPMDHMVAFFSQLLPILHADQRDKLGSSLDRPLGGRGMAGGPPVRGPADDIAFPFNEPVENQGDEH